MRFNSTIAHDSVEPKKINKKNLSLAEPCDRHTGFTVCTFLTQKQYFLMGLVI